MPDGRSSARDEPPAVEAADGTWHIEPQSGPQHWTFQPPGDQQVSLCALACASLAAGPVQIWGLLESEATISLRRVLALFGAQFVPLEDDWLTLTPPSEGLNPLVPEIDCGLDPDVLLLAMALAAGAGAPVQLHSQAQFAAPATLGQACDLLGLFGARVGPILAQAGQLEVQVEAAVLRGSEITVPASLGMLKPLALLAALRAQGVSVLDDLPPSPDHIERVFQQLGASAAASSRRIEVAGQAVLPGSVLKIPPDLSAAAPLIAAAAVRPGASLEVPMVGCNPSRAGFLRCLQRAGADIVRERDWQFGTEPVCALRVTGGAKLQPLQLAPNAAAALLPEFLLIALVVAQARGPSRLRGAGLLRQTVPDRLALATEILRGFGVPMEALGDGLAVQGPAVLSGAEVSCADDVQLGALALASALSAKGPSVLHGMGGLEQAWPQLRDQLDRLTSQ